MTKYKPQEDSTALVIATRNQKGSSKVNCNVLENGCIQYTYEDARSFVTGDVQDITRIQTQEARFIIKKLIERVFKLEKELNEVKNARLFVILNKSKDELNNV